jgi:hypothetical protein
MPDAVRSSMLSKDEPSLLTLGPKVFFETGRESAMMPRKIPGPITDA